ncbi:DsbA family protein [Nocardia callitridis]|uniref:Thioredoxin-like fold domain-containing protein n=1 Tax=Nocardia callitridis TaxID=648753 RepID=A0ABP9KY39_9NOCA
MSTNQGGWPPPSRNSGSSRRLLVASAVVLVVVIVIAIGVGLLARNALSEQIAGVPTAVGGGVTIQNVATNGSVRVGEPDAAVTVRVVMDLQCPACQAFEQANGKVLEDAVRNGTAAVEYSVISFLDRASTTRYSSRAGNASFCVADSGVDNYQKWLSEMFTRQPEEGGDGLPDSTLVDIAASAGYTDSAVADCITTHEYDTYLRTKTQEVLSSGVKSTPSVFINGEEFADSNALFTPNGLAPALAAAG